MRSNGIRGRKVTLATKAIRALWGDFSERLKAVDAIALVVRLGFLPFLEADFDGDNTL
jgi:hypothetical protein